jgi:hypothetical protein
MNSSFYVDGGKRRPAGWRRIGWTVFIFAFGGSLAAAQTNAPAKVSANEFRADNVFAAPGKLSTKIRRVAVLPLAPENRTGELPEGCAALTPVVWDQAVKSKRFEAVTINADKLRAATGRAAWTGSEVLPADFYEYLRREYACDAVLFGEVTQFRAYAPLAVGWRFRLVDLHTGRVIWAADEIFDAADKKVAKAAQRFEQPKPRFSFAESGDWAVLNSPRKFGQYSAAALLATLPER